MAEVAKRKAKKSKKQRKHSRNVDYCKFYRLTHRRERNKLVRLEKHMKRHPNDKCAQKAADQCMLVI